MERAARAGVPPRQRVVAAPFEFATAARILFGRGTIARVGPLVRELGRHALVVTGRRADRVEPVIERLRTADVLVTTLAVDGEPQVDFIERGVAIAREADCDVVLGCGGGSAIDAAKAIAILVTNPGGAFEYLEVIGNGRPLSQPGLPCAAIPTTAGTGSEATRNAVLASSRHRVKASLRSPLMFPRLALVDPALTSGLPPALTASTGLDALTQLIEAYVSSRANAMTDALCLDGIRRAATALPRACRDGDDAAARDDMALAALLSGIALSNAGLGAVHGFAGPIGGMFDAPHGAVCAALLPHVMAANLRALQLRAPDHPAIARFEQVARIVTGNERATAEASVDWAKALIEDLQVPALASHGLTAAHIPDIVENAARASSMKANPVELTEEELKDLLIGAIGDCGGGIRD